MNSEATSDYDMGMITKLHRMMFNILEDCQDILDEDEIMKILQKLEQFNEQSNNLVEIVTSLFYSLINEIKSIKSKKDMNIHQTDYSVLQQAVQKCESEIRKHIRIEQQLKLYSDSLEQKIEQYEKTIQQQKLKLVNSNKLIKAYEKDKQQLSIKIKILEQKIEGNQEKKQYKQQKQKGKPYHKHSKIMSQISFQQNQSLNNLKGSINFSFDYKKRRRQMEKIVSKSKPISREKDKEKNLKDMQELNVQIVLNNKNQQKQLLKKRNSMNLKQKQSIKYKPSKDLYEMHKTVNCYEQSQKRSKLINKKKPNETYEPSLNKQTRCSSVCK